MSPLVLLLGAAALVLVAIALLLWHSVQLQGQQEAITTFVDTQLRNAVQEAMPESGQAQEKLTPPRRRAQQWRHLFLNAGIEPDRKLVLQLLLPGVALALAALLFGNFLSMLGVVLLYVVLTYFRYWLKAVRRHQHMLHQLPDFLDSMVRLASIGNSLESAFQAALLTVESPLRDLLDRANLLVQARLDLEDALTQEARIFRLLELELVAAVIGIALRFGGRADMILERIAAFMRDREYAYQELLALSAEIRLSAWMLALLPIGLGMFMIIFNGDMFVQMLQDPIGKKMLIGAAVLEVIGAWWLYRLAKSVQS